MINILLIIQKEFIQIFRNKAMLPIIFVLPLVQLIILVNAATMEIKNVRIAVIDNDLSQTTRQLISKINASSFFIVSQNYTSQHEANNAILLGKADASMFFPSGFERQLYREGNAETQVIINAINGVTAGITNAYLNGILMGYNIELASVVNGKSVAAFGGGTLNVENSYWYNPQLNYKNFMVPAVLVILVTMIGLFLSAMNLVREKEMGTIEQINVTPIKKYQFIAGKLIPFWILALIELAVGLSIGKLLFDIPITGNLGTLFCLAAVYLAGILGIGLFISTISDTQQQAMFVTFFFVLVCIMMSGIFTAVESMPAWAQWFDRLNPVYYFMRGIRMILLKGSGFNQLYVEFISLAVFAIVIVRLAVLKYKKTVV